MPKGVVTTANTPMSSPSMPNLITLLVSCIETRNEVSVMNSASAGLSTNPPSLIMWKSFASELSATIRFNCSDTTNRFALGVKQSAAVVAPGRE